MAEPITSPVTDKTDDTLHRFQQRRILVAWALVITVFGLVMTTLTAWEEQTLAGVEIAELIEIAGLVLIGIGIVGRLWSTLYIGGRKARELVTSGPYSVVRNPLYVFSIIAATGVGAQSGSLVIAAVCGTLTALLFWFTSRREETFLADAFGADYEAYRARVPLLMPKLSLFKDSPEIVVVPARLYSTFRDGMFFFLAMPAFEFVEALQVNGTIPVLWHLW